MKTLGPSLLMIFSLACFGFFPKLQAVNPPPDGGYPGGNTAEGHLALANLNTSAGLYNTAVGIYSLLSINDGDFCTGVGAGTLLANTAAENTATGAGALLSNTTATGNTANGAFTLFSNTEGDFNTGDGDRALFSNTTGSQNTANGAAALQFNTIGENNTATGYQALLSNTTGSANSALGSGALENNIEGSDNTATGFDALFSNTSGGSNSAFGSSALGSNTTGDENTANGDNALFNNDTGSFNTAIGAAALALNTEGSFNTATGDVALLFNTIGDNNTANGYQALLSNTEGGKNTAIGAGALSNNTIGGFNTAIGYQALMHNTENFTNTAIGQLALVNCTGSGNIGLGSFAGGNLTGGSGNIEIGNPGQAGDDTTIRIGSAGNQTKTFIAGIRGVTTGINDAINVVIDSAGQLGTVSSSRRFKHDIKPMDSASEAVLALKPVTFHYKSDNTNRPEFGLVAEEVAEVNPDLVVRDETGEVYTVRYDAVNAMLLNEFLKEHRKVEEQLATISELKKEIETVVAHSKEQDAKIQKVSAQIELNRSRTKLVDDN